MIQRFLKTKLWEKPYLQSQIGIRNKAQYMETWDYNSINNLELETWLVSLPFSAKMKGKPFIRAFKQANNVKPGEIPNHNLYECTKFRQRQVPQRSTSILNFLERNQFRCETVPLLRCISPAFFWFSPSSPLVTLSFAEFRLCSLSSGCLAIL